MYVVVCRCSGKAPVGAQLVHMSSSSRESESLLYWIGQSDCVLCSLSGVFELCCAAPCTTKQTEVVLLLPPFQGICSQGASPGECTVRVRALGMPLLHFQLRACMFRVRVYRAVMTAALRAHNRVGALRHLPWGLELCFRFSVPCVSLIYPWRRPAPCLAPGGLNAVRTESWLFA